MNDEFFYKKLEEKIENKNTSLNYQQRLNALVRKINEHYAENPSNPPPKNIIHHILCHPKTYKPIIEEKYNHKELTIKNIATLILAIFKYADLKCKYEKSYKKWKEFHEEYYQKETERYNKNKPSETQKEKYISYEEMQKVYKKIKNPHETLTSSLRYCLLSMYMNIRPKRSDFGNIAIYEKDPAKQDINYLVLPKKGDSYFVFNHINKVTIKESIVEPIVKELQKVFLESLKIYPREYLFIGKDNLPFKTSNAYTKFVIRTFKHYFGKSVGTSMLRHIFVNEKIDLNKLTIEEKQAFAAAMGHDRQMQDKYKLFFDREEKN
jgi:hypothetical protein